MLIDHIDSLHFRKMVYDCLRSDQNPDDRDKLALTIASCMEEMLRIAQAVKRQADQS